MMRKWLLTVIAFLLLVSSVGLSAQGKKKGEKTDKTLILGCSSYWRYHYTMRPALMRKDGKLEKVKLMKRGKNIQCGKWLDFGTPLPPSDWREVRFNDMDWHRKPLIDPDSPWVAHLALRGKFRVLDPNKAGGLKLTVVYRGGVVVYLNGKEIGRGHLKKGAAPDDLADDYPPNNFKEHRELTDIRIPTGALRKGTNVLALEVHRSPFVEASVKVIATTAFEAGTCGVVKVRLVAPKGAAVTPNVTRPKGLQVWNSPPMSVDFDVDHGDPNEPLRPIRIVAPRGGVASGKVLVGSEKPIKGLRAVVSAFVRDGAPGRIPVPVAKVRYALPTVGRGSQHIHHNAVVPMRFDALAEVPLEEIPVRGRRHWSRRKLPDEPPIVFGAVQSVWVTVDVPPGAKAGDYAGRLTINIPGEESIVVPVELKVCDWRAPEPGDFHTFVEIVESPESVAMKYEVPLWSDEHFKLIERSFKLLGRLGNKTCYIPLICETNMGNDESMVRWIKQPDGSYKHDFTVMERYLDLVVKHQGKPMVVCFYVWDIYVGSPIVSVLDGATGKVAKSALPEHADPASRSLWEPLMREIRRRMAKRGLEKTMMLGCATDRIPAKETVHLFKAICPDISWVCHAHARTNPGRSYPMQIRDVPIGYCSGVWLRLGQPVTQGRGRGWQWKSLQTHFSRGHKDSWAPTSWRFIGEMNITGKQRGFARFGGDFFRVLKDQRGRTVGTLSARFPKTSWRALNIGTSILAPGRNGPIATARFGYILEGLQECEARICIERALTDEAKRAKLGETLAASCQKLLDERWLNIRRAVSALRAGGGRRGGAAYQEDVWAGGVSPVLGNDWFVGSDWQNETEKLYKAAAQVEQLLKRD